MVLLLARTGTKVFQAAATPDWRYLLAGLVICAAVQPLRALAWTSTVRSPVGFRAMYAASSVGSFLDTVLPGRMGEASKVAVLKVAAGPRWPGFSRAGGSLLCAHLLEMVAFVLVGAASAFFLPVPDLGARSRCSSACRSPPAGSCSSPCCTTRSAIGCPRASARSSRARLPRSA